MASRLYGTVYAINSWGGGMPYLRGAGAMHCTHVWSAVHRSVTKNSVSISQSACVYVVVSRVLGVSTGTRQAGAHQASAPDVHVIGGED